MSGDNMTYKEFIDKYGDEKVIFSEYYKYTFTFKNKSGLCICVGGCGDDIYRFDVVAGKEYSVGCLMPCSASLGGENLGFWDENM